MTDPLTLLESTWIKCWPELNWQPCRKAPFACWNFPAIRATVPASSPSRSRPTRG